MQSTCESFHRPHATSSWWIRARLIILLFLCTAAANAVTFNPTFVNLDSNSGFNDDAQGFNRLLDVAAVLAHLQSLMTDPGECDVVFQEVTSDQITGNIAVQTTYTDQSPGFRGGDAFYHITTGVDPDPVQPDITVFVHFDVFWHHGESYCVGCGPDFRTHLLSALLRGLGLQSAIASLGQSTIAPGVYTLWDELLMTGDGTPLLELNSGVPELAVPIGALTNTSIGVRFNGSQATEALGEPPFVHVQGLFSTSASLQYFQDGTTLGAAKEPIDPNIDTRRRLMPIDIGALRDIGYEVSTAPADLIVTTLSDTFDGGDTSSVESLNSNPGSNGISLREAIAACNATPGPEIIRFGVSGVILLSTPLPVILDNTGGVFIETEGTVTLDGGAQDPPGDGIEIQESNSLIRGLRFVNFDGHAIAIRSYGFGGGNRVLGCWIGLDTAGNPGNGNGSGILIQDSSYNVIGGTIPSARNVIGSLNQSGIQIVNAGFDLTGNVVIGNYIGLSQNGDAARTIGITGIRVAAADETLIGSLLPGGRNVIGRCLESGISIFGSVNAKTRVINNYVGTTANGNVGLADGGFGIVVTSRYAQIGGLDDDLGNLVSGGWESGILLSSDVSSENIIAGNRIGLRLSAQPLGNDYGITILHDAFSSSFINNIVAGNHLGGVLIMGASTGLHFEGNRIGTDASNATNLGNGGAGIAITDTWGVTIGNPNGDGNIIAYNAGPGIRMSGSANANTVQNNSIHSNEGGGIVLLPNANPDIEPPVITSIDPLEGTASAGSTVEFFADDDDQGREFITRVVLMNTNTFSLLQDLAQFEGQNLTATATSGFNGATSEFSDPIPIDLTGPVLTLLGTNPLVFEAGAGYDEPGATAIDAVDGDISHLIQISGSVDDLVPGDYFISYSVSDSAGHEAHDTRTVTVVDTTPPSITLNGPSLVNLNLGDPYVELGATAIDFVNGDLTSEIIISGDVDTTQPGDYTVFYTVQDSSGNQNFTTRTVIVTNNALPQVTLAVDPIAAPAGTPFRFTATPANPESEYTYAWNFGILGSSNEQNPTFNFTGANPGSYEIMVDVADGNLTQTFAIPITITEDAAAGSGRVDPDAETTIVVEDGPLAGATVIVPAGAVDEPVVIALSQVDNPPPVLAGAVNLLLRLEPAGLHFNVPVTVRILHPVSWYHQDDMEVLYYNKALAAWQDDGISNVVHVDAGTHHYVQYDTTHFTVFMAKSLVPSGIQGQVFSTAGDILQGATVTIDPAGINLTCDAVGFYTTIADLPPGNYIVQAKKPDTHCEDSEPVVVGEAELVRQDFELPAKNTDGSCGPTGGGGGGGGCNGTSPTPPQSAGDILLTASLLLTIACLHRKTSRTRRTQL